MSKYNFTPADRQKAAQVTNTRYKDQLRLWGAKGWAVQQARMGFMAARAICDQNGWQWRETKY